MTTAPVLEDSMEREQVLRFVRNFATWTSDFAGDFSKYQSQVRSLTQQVTDHPEQVSASDVQNLLRKITEANQNLQARLDQAEEKLDGQTKELACYLTEARTDGLTGLPNRRSFDQKIDERYARWTSHKKPFCLALIDIDFFKKVNDTYGHPAGDTVLREVATLLRSFVENGIEVARYGGEEFAFLFDGNLETAAATMEKIRIAVQGKMINSDGIKIPVTISSGVSLILADERIGKLVSRTDEALYSAKSGGRNRVFLHDGKICKPYGNARASDRIEPKPVGEDKSMAAANALQQRLKERLERFVEEESPR